MDLPDSALYTIFSYVSCPRALIRYGTVNKQWKRVAATPKHIKQMIIIPRYWDSWLVWVEATKTTFDKLIILVVRTSDIFKLSSHIPQIISKTVVIYHAYCLCLQNLVKIFPSTSHFKLCYCVITNHESLQSSAIPSPITLTFCDTHFGYWQSAPVHPPQLPSNIRIIR